jgi:hypothetical protein
MKNFNLWDIINTFGTKEEMKSAILISDNEFDKIDDFVWSFRRALIDKLTDFISIEDTPDSNSSSAKAESFNKGYEVNQK